MRKKQILSPFLLIFMSYSASAQSPVVEGLGGAGRAGLPNEAMFTNPASLAMLADSGSFLYYTKPSINVWNAGGRGYAVGAYDGGSPAAKAGFATIRRSRARIGVDGRQVYDDRTEYRLATGTALWSGLMGGLQARYILKKDGGPQQKIFTGDVGALYPIFQDILLGLTYENALNKNEGEPTAMGAGAFYKLGDSISLFGDGKRFMKGAVKGQRGWSLGGQINFAGDFSLRAGRFQEPLRRIKGWSWGLGWGGPRAGFHYAMRLAGDLPREKDHIFGMNLSF